jgi:hypothetical protein
MNFKLDENFGSRCAELLRGGGHDVATVFGQQMSGAADSALLARCHQERRCLVTLDLDFANPLRFPPAEFSGIAVVRLPRQATHSDLIAAVTTLVDAVKTQELHAKLWIVEIGRIRIYRPETE